VAVIVTAFLETPLRSRFGLMTVFGLLLGRATAFRKQDDAVEGDDDATTMR
tara:strand:+ start:11349 stop:11501 length:153 start_codon:yes stop_codon:yes gene_type:complete